MAPHRRRRIIASRRRREDEGEDGGSAGEIEDDSMSEGTMSNPDEDPDDGEDSEASETAADGPKSNGQVHAGAEDAQQPEGKSTSGMFSATVSDTEAMLNGMKLSEEAENMAEIHFDDMKADLDEVEAMAQKPEAETKAQKQQEIGAEWKQRERENYIKERDSNPAFVPTRGGFFLHDKRNTEGPTNSYRGNNRPKSRPHGLIVDSNMERRSSQKPDVTDGQWEHDLHDSVIHEDRPAAVPPSSTVPNRYAPSPSRGVPTAPRSSPPNRSFSTTLLVGNVPVVVFLPGMENPIPFSAVPKRQHTRLPQHRPPLRRDKPVRISLPGQPPRYIFPATERSFIFIPRALRPNQQSSYRGRGRGGFYGGFGSRRTSVYGGSIYTPSVAMSRRSSFGRAASGEGFQSPAGSVMSRPGMVPGEGGKPVVRLPPPVRPPVPGLPSLPPNVPPPPMPNLPHPPPYLMPQNPAFRENRPTPVIPMHQPRPQKAVSVADIESPASFPYNAPPQQQEQPFHQQVPPPQGFVPESGYPPQPGHAPHPSQASAGTPLSQIPERAIHAQPFQPYPYQQPQPYYPSSGYPPGTVFYPPANAEYGGYTAGPQPPYAPPNQPASYPMQPQQPTDQSMASGTVAHESNGTVYYYDSSQFQNTGYPPPPPPNSGYPMTPQGGVVGMGGMMTPPGANYYYGQPQGQAQNGTVYYQ